MRTPKIKSSTDKSVFRNRQSNVQRLTPASNYCRALFRCLNCAQRFDYHALISPSVSLAIWEYKFQVPSSAVVGSWEEPPNIWLLAAKNAFVGWALNCRVRMLLKVAVTTIFANIWSWSVNVPDQRSKVYLQITRRIKCHLCKMAPVFIGCKCHLKLFLSLFPIFQRPLPLQHFFRG